MQCGCVKGRQTLYGLHAHGIHEHDKSFLKFLITMFNLNKGKLPFLDNHSISWSATICHAANPAQLAIRLVSPLSQGFMHAHVAVTTVASAEVKETL